MGNLAPPGDREESASHHSEASTLTNMKIIENLKSADLRSSVLELFEYRCLHICPTLRVDSDVFGRSRFSSNFMI